MSMEDVYLAFGPMWDLQVPQLRDDLAQAQRIVLALRRMLREHDPSLPDEYDGNAWAPHERSHTRGSAATQISSSA